MMVTMRRLHPWRFLLALAYASALCSCTSLTAQTPTSPGADAPALPTYEIQPLDEPGITLTTPADGRLRGFGFSAVVTGYRESDAAGTGFEAVSAPSGDILAVVRVQLSTFTPAYDGASLAGTMTSSFVVGHYRVANNGGLVDGSNIYAISVPRGAPVALDLSEAGLTDGFSINTGKRLAPLPAILYRSPTGPVVTDKAEEAVHLSIVDPADGFKDSDVFRLYSAQLTYFAPQGATVHPPLDDAFLVLDASDEPGPPGAIGLMWQSALPPDRMRLVLPSGRAIAASPKSPYARSVPSSLLTGGYYFQVPWTFTKGTVVITPGSTQATEYGPYLGVPAPTNDTVLGVARFKVSFPAPVPFKPVVTKSKPPVTSGRGTQRGSGTSLLVTLVPIISAVALLMVLFWRHRRKKAARARQRRPRVVEAPVAADSSTLAGPHVVSRGTDDYGEEFIRVVVPPPGLSPPPPAGNGHGRPPAETGSSGPLPLNGAGDGGDKAREEAPPSPSPSPPREEAPDSSVMPSSPELAVLGPVELTGSATPIRRKLVELLCYLAIHRGRSVPAEELRAALWSGDSGPDASAKTLRNYISILREELGEDIVPQGEKGLGYRVGPALGCDWFRFSSLVASARTSSDDEAVPLLGEALMLFRGVPFQGTEPGSYAWAGAVIAEIEVAVVVAASRLATIHLARGEPDKARSAATRGLVGVPYDLSLWALVVESSEHLGPSAYESALRDARLVLGEAASLLAVRSG